MILTDQVTLTGESLKYWNSPKILNPQTSDSYRSEGGVTQAKDLMLPWKYTVATERFTFNNI